MGAEHIYFTLPGNLTKRDIEKELARKREKDREYNGHKEGYSGDWQTIHGMNYEEHKTFNNFIDAEDYCESQLEKGEGLAVKFKTSSKDFKTDKKYIKVFKEIQDQVESIREEEKKYRAKADALFADMKSAKSKTIGCGECGSSLNRQYLKTKSCPLCGTNLLSATAQSQITKMEDKLKAMIAEHSAHKAKLEVIKQEVIDDNAETKWLIYGVASC